METAARSKTAADARRIVKERGAQPRQGGASTTSTASWARQVHPYRQVPFGASTAAWAFCDVCAGLGTPTTSSTTTSPTPAGTPAIPDANVRPPAGDLPRESRPNPATCCSFASSSTAPRSSAHAALLRRVLARAARMGFEVKVGFRIRVLCLLPRRLFSIREERLQEPEGRSRPASSATQCLRNSVLSDFYKDLLAMCEGHGYGHRGSAHGDRRRCARGGAQGQ